MSTFYLKLSQDWQEHFLLNAASAIIVSTCLGGLSVFFIFQNGSILLQMLQLFLVVTSCTTVLASILTVQKPKVVLHALIGSVVVSLFAIVFNTIF